MEPMSPDGRPETVAAAAQQQPLEWRFAQVFGERAASEDVQEGNKTCLKPVEARFSPVAPAPPREICSVPAGSIGCSAVPSPPGAGSWCSRPACRGVLHCRDGDAGARHERHRKRSLPYPHPAAEQFVTVHTVIQQHQDSCNQIKSAVLVGLPLTVSLVNWVMLFNPR
uniref:Uncharacterized protein n=1 Tax=Arundo donax TaxID=35708 RepID=A0A0A8YBS5_ARUDO